MRTDWAGCLQFGREYFKLKENGEMKLKKKKMICVKSFVYSLDLTPMGPFTL